MQHIKEIAKAEYDNGVTGAGKEINWYAAVLYSDQVLKYFVFDEPYNVLISDFFDMTNKDNPIITMTFV